MKQSLNASLTQNGLARLQFNRPDKGNMYDEDVLVALITALDDFAQDDRVRVLAISGEGIDFCLGADPAWLGLARSDNQDAASLSAGQISRMLEALRQFPVPTLAEVQGRARAGALGILACCDYVVGTDDSRYLVNEIHASIMPVISTPYLCRAIGERRVRALVLTGDELTAEQALAAGLLHESVAPDQLAQAVNRRLNTWLATPVTALRQAKLMLNRSTVPTTNPEQTDELAELLTLDSSRSVPG